ncbi:MAG: response regulator [Desulfovibrionaceae bacterium]|nr:response regulator [Desulfovibrionaceae bacterium]MBF0512571.1 response regulator [Desulfovibrionaceae bacterium]
MSSGPVRILAIDDEPVVRESIAAYLEDSGFTMLQAQNGREGLDMFRREKPDLVLVDLRMPEVDGLDVLSAVRRESPGTPVVVVSGTGVVQDAIEALRRGAWDFVAKPVADMAVLEHAVAKALERAGLLRENAVYQTDLETRIRERTEDLERANVQMRATLAATINSIATMAEMRDPYTAGHQKKVSLLAEAMAKELGLSEDRVACVRVAGMVHDIGKVCVPLELLAKPSRLEVHEMAYIKMHSTWGHEILKDIPLPWPVAEIVLQHHERMDGSGYPRGLAGPDLLEQSRIIAVADVVEAMSAHRPYRPAMGVGLALAEIAASRGVKYCPDCVDACTRILGPDGCIENAFCLLP